MSWWDFAYVLSTLYFPFLVGHGEDLERKEGFRPFRETFNQRAWKQSESLVLQVVPDEEFLHTKINKKYVLNCGVTEDILEGAFSLRQIWRRFDSEAGD